MAKSFKILRDKMSSKSKSFSKKIAGSLRKEMALNELRYARNLTQEQLAKILEQSQANISKLEKRTDIYISTLRSYIEAIGGHLEILAHFPEGDVKIKQFQEIGAAK